MKKQVNLSVTDNGLKYFHVYEVRALKHNGEVVTSDIYLNKKDAEADMNNIFNSLSSLYKNAWITETLVWC